jgi:heat shock protein HslJ
VKKLILMTMLACAALWGCVHADGGNSSVVHKQTDTALDLTGKCILDTRWRLVELMGKPVAADERFPFIHLQAKEGRISGFGGCNSIGGSYELKAGNRVRFTNMASTMMACPDMNMEQEFFNVLDMTDNFACDGQTLFLHKARMAPLAKFEAVP